MKNINDYKICKAIVSLENEVDMLKNKFSSCNVIGSELPDGSIDLTDYVTNDNLTDTLTNYVLKSEIPDLTDYVTNDNLLNQKYQI